MNHLKTKMVISVQVHTKAQQNIQVYTLTYKEDLI